MAFTGLLGIRARRVSTTGFTSRILEAPSAALMPWPRWVTEPRVRPTMAAMETMVSATPKVEVTSFFKLAPWDI